MLENNIKELSLLSGISGRENLISDYIIQQVKDYADSFKVDNLGNLIVFKKGKNTPRNKIMIDAHMDEVGFIVTYIDDSGFLKFSNVGGINTKVFIGKTVKIGKNNISGVIGIVPIHLTSKDNSHNIPDNDSLYIDIGASSKEEAMKYVKPGDSVVFDSDYIEFGENSIKCKALDDRAGCAIMIELIKSELEFDTYFSFSTQEETGLRGAAASAYSISPDYAICVETTTASDIPGVDEYKRVCSLNKGAVVSYMDRSTLYPMDLYEKAFSIAEHSGIKVQTKSVVAGGNNAGAIHKSKNGVKVITVSIPCRYLHSPSCVINKHDVEQVYNLVKLLAEDFANA